MNPRQRARLENLLSALCDEALEPSQAKELEKILESSAEARRHYAEYLVLHGDLSWDMPAHAEREVQDAPLLDVLPAERWWQRWMRHPQAAALSVAAVLMIAVLGLLAILAVPDQLPDPTPVYVARMSRTIDCTWKDGGLGKAEGTDLIAGQELELLSGLAVITFDSGAQVVLEGRSHLRIDSPSSGHLIRGKLAAEVPGLSNGFTITTQRANVIDRGTEFGVDIRNPDDTRVHVFVGAVDVEVLDESGRVIATHHYTAGQGVQLDSKRAQVRQISAAAADFTRDIPSLGDLPITPGYVQAIREAGPVGYWRFEAAGGNVPNEMGPKYAARVAGQVGREQSGENQVAVFDGKGGHLIVDEPIAGFGQGDYSIEFWMLPSQFHYSTLVSLHVPPKDDAKTMYDHHGVVELLTDATDPRSTRRIRFLHRSPPGTGGGANVFSAQRYQLQRWQHLVALKQGDELRIFVDGQLAASRTEPTNYTQDPILGIGKLLHPRGSGGRHFLGQIDEVAIYRRALSPQEIHKHYQLVKDLLR